MSIIEMSSSPSPVNFLEWNIIMFVHWGMMLHLVRSICERCNLIWFDLSNFPCNLQVIGRSSSLLEAQEIPLDVLKRDCQLGSVVSYLCVKSASWFFVFEFFSFDCFCCKRSWDFKLCSSFVCYIFIEKRKNLIQSAVSIFLEPPKRSKIFTFCRI